MNASSSELSPPSERDEAPGSLDAESARAEGTKQAARATAQSSSSLPEEERAFWVDRLNAKLAEVRSKPNNLDAIQELGSDSILAWLTVEGRYEVVEAGVAIPIRTSDQVHEIRISSRFGHRSYRFQKAEFTEYWEVLEHFSRPHAGTGLSNLPSIDSELAGRIEALAALALAKLEPPPAARR